MRDQYLQALEDALWDAATRSMDQEQLKPRALRAAIQSVSDAYNEVATRSGKRLVARELQAISREARLAAQSLFFTVADAPKLAYCMAELAARGALPGRLDNILDVGAGCGAQTFGLLLAAHELDLDLENTRIRALDLDQGGLTLMQRCHRELGAWARGSSLITERTNLERAADTFSHDGRGYDLIYAGTVLNELAPRAQLQLVRALLRALSSEGVLLVIEPALKATTRTLHALRNTLVEKGEALVVAPCTHHNPCPALTNDDDWCHEHRIWQLAPARFRKLAAATLLRRRDIKFSYLSLVPAHREVAPPPYPLRVVGKLHREKGRRSIQLCGAAGYCQITRLDRHRSTTNAPFQELGRGQLASIHPFEGKPRQQLDSRAEVQTTDCTEKVLDGNHAGYAVER